MLKGQKKSEIILYLVLWTILFAAPLLSMYVSQRESGTAADDWHEVLHVWRMLFLFFAAFCLHNFLVAPLLVYHNRNRAYILGVALLLACCVGGHLCMRPPHGPHDGMRPAPELHEPPGNKGPEPPRDLGIQGMVPFIILTLLLGLNIGTKYFFKSVDDRKRMEQLERENLNRQLEYLKYQISPHFFMNTLNNIHALVDIDPEQAKHTIEVLSKLMRYALYEGNKTMAPLAKELAFISHYVDLMRLRYTDKVRISVSLPDSVPEVMVPSLLFTTFVENAFKHGISYRRESFVEVSARVNEVAREVEFLCVNSKIPAAEDKHGGVGLQNAEKRLRLIYGDGGYRMEIDDREDEYRLLLRLPIT